MHNTDWKIELKHLFVILLCMSIPGWIFNAQSQFLLLGCLLYIAWTLFQLNRVQHWLSIETDQDPPESRGLWGDVYDGIYRLQREGRQERDRLQASVDYLQDSFASLDDAAVMIDKRGHIEWSNNAAERLLGLKYPSDKGGLLVNLIRAPEFIQYFETKDYLNPLDMVSPHHSELALQIHLTLFGKGSRLLFARDVTHTHRLEEMRKDFVANVSHELRTPLTVINGYLETLADYDYVEHAQLKKAIQQMLGQSRRMETLIKDLILLSRLESVPEPLAEKQIDLESMLEMIREEVIAARKGKGLVTVNCDPDLPLYGHSEELYSAFANLVMNAAKYADEDGEIVIRWHKDGHHARLDVTDTGVGIEAHHLSRLTERFYRVDNSRSIDTGGTGLGLAIVKHVLLRHHAELKIESQLGEGSTFSCIFPLR